MTEGGGALEVVGIGVLGGLVARDAGGHVASGHLGHARADAVDHGLRVRRLADRLAQVEARTQRRVGHVHADEVERRRRPRARRPRAVLDLAAAGDRLRLVRGSLRAVELRRLEVGPHGLDVVVDGQVDLVDVGGMLDVPERRVLDERDLPPSLPRLDRVGARADGLPGEGLRPDLVDVVDGRDRGDRVTQRRREVGERVAERDLQRLVVDRLDAGEALSRIGLVAAVVAALDGREDVGDVGLVLRVGDPGPRVDEVLGGDLTADRRLERHPGLEVEDPRLGVGGLPRLRDVRLGAEHAVVVQHPLREPLEHLMGDLQAGGVLRVERLDGERLSGQREGERAARLGRALVARHAAVRRPRGAGGERGRPDEEEGGHRQEDDEPGRTQATSADEGGHTSARGLAAPGAQTAVRRPRLRHRTGSAARGRRQPSLQMRTNVFRKNTTPTMMV